MNEPQVILDCIPCIFWNLVVPALAWALVIAGLTWTIRDRIRRNGFDPSPEESPTESDRGSVDSVLVNQPLDRCVCCSSFIGIKSSMRGEETCTQKK